MTSTPEQLVREDGYKWGFYDEEEALFKANKGLTPEIVQTISEMKDEPQWMREFRLNALERFNEMENPPWGTGPPRDDRLRQHPLLRAGHGSR